MMDYLSGHGNLIDFAFLQLGDFSTLSLLFLIAIGILIGVVSGLTGLGGGVLMVPSMLYIYPIFAPPEIFSMKVVTGIAATQGLAGSASASIAHYRRGNSNINLILFVAVGSVFGAYLGGISSSVFSNWWLKIVYVCLLSAILVLFYKRGLKKTPDTDPEVAKNYSFKPKHHLAVFSAAFGIGLVAGLLGIGGAVFLFPLIHFLLDAPVRITIGCTSGVVLFSSIASVAGKYQTGLVPLPEALIVAAGALIGGQIGARLSTKFSEYHLKLMIVGFISITLTRVIWELIFP